jgi:hypothetical protein
MTNEEIRQLWHEIGIIRNRTSSNVPGTIDFRLEKATDHLNDAMMALESKLAHQCDVIHDNEIKEIV